jgi:hypothetical protein
MKHLFWIFLFIVGASACKNEGSSTGNGDAGQGVAATKEAEGGFLPPLNPGTSQLVTLLSTEYWVFEFYVVEDPVARQANRGRWFKFKSDGTFINGHWQEQTGYGSWRLEEDKEDKTIIHVDNIYNSQDAQWEIQGISQEKDVMTWVGVNRTPTAGSILKVINLSARPTKAQFGVEE